MRIFAATARYIQGPGALALLPKEAQRLGRRPVLVGDAGVQALFGPTFDDAFRAAGIEATFLVLTGEITAAAVDGLAAAARTAGADVAIGVGGGKSLDAGKGVALALGLPFISVPTIASTDAPASAGLALYDDHHLMSEIRQMKRNPDCVLVDTAVIARAPLHFLRAGIGDALAKKFEAESCAAAGGRTKHGTGPGVTGLAIADACYRTIRAHAAGALAAAGRGEPDDALEALVEATVLMSALGFENGGLSVAHAVTRGLMQARGAAGALHGYHVAYGTMVHLALEGRDGDALRDMAGFLRSVGLPATLRELGTTDATPADMRMVAEGALTSANVRNFPVAVTVPALQAAINRVETLN